MTAFNPGSEFDRQVHNLVDKGYPALTGKSEGEFVAGIRHLREVAIARSEPAAPPTRARVPFVLVITSRLAPVNDLMPHTNLKGKQGFSIFEPDDIGRFGAIKDVAVPDSDAYLVFDLDRGKETLNVAPDKAMLTITEHGRTPITVEEGIAFITHFPGALEKNNCFSLVASRCGDKRVPALWISKGAPKLGWCWAGNPHTWLGSASCAGRAG